MTDTTMQWYELPIEVGTSSSFPALCFNVGPTENERGRLPERHYWKDEEEQRAEVADLQWLAWQLELEKATDDFLDAVARTYSTPLIMPDMGADEEVESDGSTGA